MQDGPPRRRCRRCTKYSVYCDAIHVRLAACVEGSSIVLCRAAGCEREGTPLQQQRAYCACRCATARPTVTLLLLEAMLL